MTQSPWSWLDKFGETQAELDVPPTILIAVHSVLSRIAAEDCWDPLTGPVIGWFLADGTLVRVRDLLRTPPRWFFTVAGIVVSNSTETMTVDVPFLIDCDWRLFADQIRRVVRLVGAEPPTAQRDGD